MPDVGIPGATEPEVEQMHPEPTTVADARAGNKEADAQVNKVLDKHTK